MATIKAECTCSILHSPWMRLRCTKCMTISKAREAMKSFHCPKSAKRDRVMVLLHRAERGLLSYDAFTKPELEVFVNGRQLQAMIPPSTPKKAIITLLEVADENATFDGFLELPPELRLRIYELHFETFAKVTSPVQPPVTNMSRLTRKESLPLFYQQARFAFQASSVSLFSLDTELSGYDRKLCERLPKEFVPRIKRLRIGRSMLFEWDIDLFLTDGKFKVQRLMDTDAWEEEMSRADARIDSVMKDMVEREGPRHLRREDIPTLIEAIKA